MVLFEFRKELLRVLLYLLHFFILPAVKAVNQLINMPYTFLQYSQVLIDIFDLLGDLSHPLIEHFLDVLKIVLLMVKEHCTLTTNRF